MKKIKLQLLILLIPMSINLCAQDIQRFLGTYHLKKVCKNMLDGSVFPDEGDVVITEGIESDLLINIGGSAGFNDFLKYLYRKTVCLYLFNGGITSMKHKPRFKEKER